ncbi:MAG TPA: GtrA family protein [Beijerinckia sp.]|jgi:putative flippase GtrA|nr:GtrA family protein [Beijerinckia sp.]
MSPNPPRLSDRDRSTALLLRYVLFAIIAGAMNLGSQAVVIRLAPVEPLELSILAGTGVGFVVKYILDKRWIFFDNYDGAKQEARKIFFYGSFSVAMTLVFWGFELAFLAIGGSDFAKYTGGVIGLAIGNFAKYLLDRTYTFKLKAQT